MKANSTASMVAMGMLWARKVRVLHIESSLTDHIQAHPAAHHHIGKLDHLGDKEHERWPRSRLTEEGAQHLHEQVALHDIGAGDGRHPEPGYPLFFSSRMGSRPQSSPMPR